MKTYTKVWIMIALIVDVVIFGSLTLPGSDIIQCNREYHWVYPCNTISVVYSEIPIADPGNIHPVSDDYHYEAPNHEPSLVAGKKFKSDLAVVIEVVFIVDLALAGIAVLLYHAVDNYENRQTSRSMAFSVALVACVIGFGFGLKFLFKHITHRTIGEDIHYNAPIIYLYDEQEREVTVKLDLNGELTCTYPKYDEKNGWTVKTSADGVLTDKNGRKYEYLYWEADVDMVPDFSKGFCVRGEDSAAFLEKALSDLGLSDTEANAFIMYWLPDLEENPYNVIAFQTDTYEDVAKLDVDPLPDTVVRVNMLFYGSDEYVDMVEQDLAAMNPSLEEREGFVLVEWGGGKLG